MKLEETEIIKSLFFMLLNTTTAILREDWEDAKIHAKENREFLEKNNIINLKQ